MRMKGTIQLPERQHLPSASAPVRNPTRTVLACPSLQFISLIRVEMSNVSRRRSYSCSTASGNISLPKSTPAFMPYYFFDHNSLDQELWSCHQFPAEWHFSISVLTNCVMPHPLVKWHECMHGEHTTTLGFPQNYQNKIASSI